MDWLIGRLFVGAILYLFVPSYCFLAYIFTSTWTYYGIIISNECVTL